MLTAPRVRIALIRVSPAKEPTRLLPLQAVDITASDLVEVVARVRQNSSAAEAWCFSRKSLPNKLSCPCPTTSEPLLNRIRSATSAGVYLPPAIVL